MDISCLIVQIHHSNSFYLDNLSKLIFVQLLAGMWLQHMCVLMRTCALETVSEGERLGMSLCVEIDDHSI